MPHSVEMRQESHGIILRERPKTKLKSIPGQKKFIAENETMMSFLSYVWISAKNIIIKTFKLVI